MASTSASIPSQDVSAESLAQDRPTIEAALKTFLSLDAARNLTRDEQHSSGDSLAQARSLLKTINQYTFPLLPEPSEEYKVTSQIWNGLIASNKKPSKFLGRTALKLAWEHGLPGELPKTDEENLFVKEFGSLLLSYDPKEAPTHDSDACLVWDADKGETELGRRRSRRADRAKEAKERAESALTIEELPGDDEVEMKEESKVTIEELPDETEYKG